MAGEISDSFLTANPFHAGNTCPFCQEQIAVGQEIVSCGRCGSLQHHSCWLHNRGCASYNCAPRSRAETGLAPEITITAAAAAQAVVPVVPRRQGALEATRRFLEQGPARRSTLALLCLVTGGLSLLLLLGTVSGSRLLLGWAMLTSLAALTLGLIALVLINRRRGLTGTAHAFAGLTAAALVLFGSLISLHGLYRGQRMDNLVEWRVLDRLPQEEDLRRMPPPLAGALRANVVIRSPSAGLLVEGLSIGSGIVLKVENNRAYVLTNKHVIGEGEAVEVRFYSGEATSADILWLAPGEIDLAVIGCQTLTMTDYRPLAVADDQLVQGQPVFAVGNPANLAWTYTEGVISAVRDQEDDGRPVLLYQTQTPINFGNSGGGLYDANGRLVGVNTWTKDKSVTEGLNFAISTLTLLELWDDAERQRFTVPAAATPGPAPTPTPALAPPVTPPATGESIDR